MDTGVDYLHSALGGCFGKKCLVSYGYDLVGNYWEGFEPPSPDDDPYDDCIGHGTHVAGIIAAQPNKMNFTGVAPGATLGMYKVFSCVSYGTTDDVLISALYVSILLSQWPYLVVGDYQLTPAQQHGVRRWK